MVTIPKPFAVGKFEVTFAEWDACVATRGCKHKPEDRGWGRDQRPVINVSWYEATNEYLRWLSRKASKKYRLLTEAEWEYAARAGTQTTYSWGNEIGRARANCQGCGSEWDNRTAPVGSFQANSFGLHDMHGNVWEWVADCMRDNYDGAPNDGSAQTGGSCNRRPLRGGAWNWGPTLSRSSERNTDIPDSRGRLDDHGVRVARTLAP